MSEYRIQRLKEDLTYAQQRNKNQKQQLANYKKVHEKDLKEIERLKEEYVMLQNASDEVEEEKDQEIERLNNIINECANDILKELKENNHLSYGVALAIRQKLLDYKELKGDDKE